MGEHARRGRVRLVPSLANSSPGLRAHLAAVATLEGDIQRREFRMNDKVKVGAAIVGTAIVVGGGGAIAAGKTGSGSSPPAAGLRFVGTAPGGGPLQAAADYLGLSLDALRTQLQAGQTLAQVAAAQGKSVSGLEDALVADARSHLDAAVAAGKLTAGEESSILAEMTSHVDDLVNGKVESHLRGPGPGAGPALDAAATYLGLTADELRTQLQAGKTLAQVAAAEGKSVAGLEDALVADAKSHLDAAVSAGDMTADQARAMLDKLTAHVDDLVNAVPGARPGPLGPPPVSSTATA
jgi:hypothetical protein